MSIVLNSTSATLFADLTGTALSDSFTVNESGVYNFTAMKVGSFSALTFQLQAFNAYQARTLATWDAVAISTVSLALNAGTVYRLNCSAFTGGASASVVAKPQNGSSDPVPSRIASFPLNGWTPIVAPIPCNYYFVIENQDGSALLRCSDPNDPATQYEIPAGASFALIVPAVEGNSPRFNLGDTVTFLKSAGGNGPAVVEFYL